MDTREFDLANFLNHPFLALRRFIAPTILRLAEKRKDHFDGERIVPVEFKPLLTETAHPLEVRFVWRVREWEAGRCYNEFREELGKLRETLNQNDVTELAALGVAFGLVAGLLPGTVVTKVATPGQKGDYYLNRSGTEMIEMSGVLQGEITGRFREKEKQILENPRLTRAMVCVTGFSPLLSRLECVL